MKIASITDGTSNTIAWAEICHGKYSQFGCNAGGGCDFNGSGWWADADYDDSTITSFYPPNVPIPPVYYTTGSWQNPDGCDSGNNIPPMTSMSYHPGGVNVGVRRRLGALHQELDQFVELAGHHTHFGQRCKVHDPGRHPQGVWQSLSTINGGEVISSDSY